MKLIWSILKEPNKIWVKVVTTKYIKSSDSGFQLRSKVGGSPIWRGICSVWHEMRSTSQLRVWNGRDTLFWTSWWLDNDINLVDYATRELSESDLKMIVEEAGGVDNCWNWDFLHSVLSPDIVGFVAGMEPPKRR
ncbi:hypothetical protein LINPERHAP2_LOCUS9057 [Linum perenne]